MKTLILGASDKPDRYSYKAMMLLKSHGHEIILVHPNLKAIAGHLVLPSLKLLNQPVDTVTIYVNPAVSDTVEFDLIRLKPRRVIFNPGAENHRLAFSLKAAGIKTENACTLVLLQTGQF